MYLLSMVVLCTVVLALDFVLHTHLVANWKFWAMQLFTVLMVVLFDLYANGRIWFFNPEATIGVTILTTPLENLLFGFALITLSLVLFEKTLPALPPRTK
jgi:lycopene cyclase domain-containing protein